VVSVAYVVGELQEHERQKNISGYTEIKSVTNR
jgi:hypothetical protein